MNYTPPILQPMPLIYRRTEAQQVAKKPAKPHVSAACVSKSHAVVYSCIILIRAHLIKVNCKKAHLACDGMYQNKLR